MQKDNKNSRRDFLKIIPLALGSVVALTSFKFPFRKKDNIPQINVNSIAKEEAEELIRTNKQAKSNIKPMPAPETSNVLINKV